MSKLMDFWNHLSRRPTFINSPRRIFLLVAVIGIIGTGYWLFSTASAPELISLSEQPLSKAQLSKASACLSKWGLTYKISGSFILVEPDKQADLLARMDFLSDSPAASAREYGDLLKGGIFLSESQRHQRWRLSREEALAAQIRNFRGLRSARVFLADAARDGFGAARLEPSASVIVWTQDDQPLASELALAIRQTIAGSVSGLSTKNVHVIDAASGRYSSISSPSDRAGSPIRNFDRRADQLAAQWEQKIRDNLYYIPQLIVSVSLLASDQTPPGDVTPSSAAIAEPSISVAVNIPRSYLVALHYRRAVSDSIPTDTDVEAIAAEQIAKITATIRAVVGQPTSSHVHVDWYYDNPAAESVTLADTTAAVQQAWPSSFSRWLQPAYLAAAIAMVSLLALLAVVVRRWTGPNRQQRAIALSRLDAERHYLKYTAPEQSAQQASLALESSYSDPAATELSAFEELLKLDDATLRGLLTRTEPRIVALALRTASDDLRRKILADLACERRQAVLDHPDFAGPVRLSDIEAAQQELLDLLELPQSSDSELVASASD